MVWHPAGQADSAPAKAAGAAPHCRRTGAVADLDGVSRKARREGELMMLTRLSTERLDLAELGFRDVVALEAFQSQPDYCRLQAVEPAEFADGTRRVEGYILHRGAGARRRLYVWTARRRVDYRVVGSVGLTRLSATAASLGFGVDPALSGQGLAAEMATAVLDYGFGELGLAEIGADVAIENAASLRVLEKLGMRRVGVCTDAVFAQGRWWTEARYSRRRQAVVEAA
jgi:ribosomal-protein-alanine N-acetyltransferase